ncbi:MAG TPA: DinB family protein [Thermoanaerobaculia bacterium]|nr:DinB family protein [Thermoanaerobaculia bacterium]
MKNAGRPQAGEYGSYYQRYIDLASEDDIVAALDAQAGETAALLAGLSEPQAAHRYAPDKWSIKQLVGHVTDAERIFAYRALAIARGETKPLPGFDQEPYVVNSGADERPMSDLAGELAAVRRANVMMLRALPDEAWRRIGTASENPISVRALAYIILGHERHHMGIVRDRYLGAATPPRTA